MFERGRFDLKVIGAGLLLAVFACVDDAVPDEPAKAASVRTIPVTRERSLQPGQSVEVALQVLDSQGAGINGVECFFAVSEPDALGFDVAASAESTQRISTSNDQVDSVRASGLAVARLTGLETAEPRTVRIWAGIASAESVADGAEDTALQVWQFSITVTPAEKRTGDSGAGGGP